MPHLRRRHTDAIRKFACSLAHRFDVVGLESLQIKTMTDSARARAMADVEQVRRLNRAIRRSCWGVTQKAIGNAFEARGSRALKFSTMDSSETCAEDGHVESKSRKGKRFRCSSAIAGPRTSASSTSVRSFLRLPKLIPPDGLRCPSVVSFLPWSPGRTARRDLGRAPIDTPETPGTGTVARVRSAIAPHLSADAEPTALGPYWRCWKVLWPRLASAIDRRDLMRRMGNEFWNAVLPSGASQ